MIPWPAIRGIAGKGTESPHWPQGSWWLEETLAGIPKGERWTTRQLLASFGPLGKGDSKALVQALWRMRASGQFDDCWSRDPERSHMGNPLILWHRQAGEPTEHRTEEAR